VSLEAILAARRERSVGRIKPEHKGKQERHIAELRTSGAVDRALGVGDPAPAFALPNTRGETVSSAALLASGPLVVSFFRGAWCPYCVAELEALDEIVPELTALGARLVTITPQRVERMAALSMEKNFRFDLLTDHGNRVAEAYRVGYEFPDYLRDLYRDILKHDIAVHNDDVAWKLPIPARFVIDGGGTVRESKIDADYRHRPEPAESLAIVRDLVAARV
jgi:peroxiredoxin